jgi:hypothetical protein
MQIVRRACALLLVCSAAWATAPHGLLASPPEARTTPYLRPFPDPVVFARQVRAAMEEDEELARHFSYTETRRDVRVSRLGKVEVGPERTFEVYPSSIPGRTYKRLIAIDGKALAPDELARRDREHQERLARLADRRARESAKDRARRLEEEAEDAREREAIVADAFAVFQPAFVGRETLDGHELLVVALSPREDARVATREGRWMQRFEGRAWVSEADHRIVRLEMRARDDVSIGWGILGRIHEGSRLVYTRRKFQGAWLPAQLIFDATGRTLLFRTFDLDLVTTYSGYKRVEGDR